MESWIKKRFNTVVHNIIAKSHQSEHSRGQTPLQSYAETKESRLLRYCEMEVYLKHFQLKIFYLANLNVPFLCQIVLLACNYIVLITQTERTVFVSI